MQLDVKRAAVFCVGHLVRRCQLVHRCVGGQAVCKKLLVAGHELRIRNVEVIIRADTVILERIQAAAKLAFDHDRVQPCRVEPLVESCKFRCPYGLVQHLRDDLLLDGGEQRRVFRSGGRFAHGLEEDRQQLLLIGQRKNGRPVHLFGGQISTGDGSFGDMQKLSLRGGQGHVNLLQILSQQRLVQ